MLDHILAHPLYIPFILLNIFIIYKVIRLVLENDEEKNDDDRDGGIARDEDPVLDLPPGVSLPREEPSLSV
jgi:hypothetical protein